MHRSVESVVGREGGGDMSLADVFANSLTGGGVEHAGLRWVADGSVGEIKTR